LTKCLFIVIISIGVHNHLPPPSTKTLFNIIENLWKIIEKEHNLSLTTRQLLT
ncbi:1979_t:CDS:1, partial [Racocetra persica]